MKLSKVVLSTTAVAIICVSAWTLFPKGISVEKDNATVSGSAPSLQQIEPSFDRITGWVDTPVGDIRGDDVHVSGWALDPEGIERVEVRVEGRVYLATYGSPRPDVTKLKPGFPQSSAPGFEFIGSLAMPDDGRNDRRRPIEIVAVNVRGTQKVLGRRNLVPKTLEWQTKHEHASLAAEPFYVVPGVSGIALGGAQELGETYRPYLSPTFRFGMRVPILYMRTTHGAAKDWRFDPNWDISKRCGERRIAEDSLSDVIAYATEHRIPVLFTLNGGVWSDASCGVPDWDVTDYLETDPLNCQWNDRNQVREDDSLKHLPGSQDNPELGRILTFNVHAKKNRHYKKRNLQAAAALIRQFATAEPELFIGVNLDPDTVHNPFFEEQEWYDYNPGTVKQFRQWLSGTGPYSTPSAGLDLRKYRRVRPLTFAEARALSGQNVTRWDEVEPPRRFPRERTPFWEDAWTYEWELFRRHLVDLHYDDLSRWLVEAGIQPSKIFSAQGFMAPAGDARPFATRLDSPPKNYDSGGVSVEGAFPSHGHIGAVVYGPAARNQIAMESSDSLFATFSRFDSNWAIVEFNTADLRNPSRLPDYRTAYEALRDATNFGARFVSPMAWNGSNGLFAGQPGYVSYVAWRNTPLEDAVRDLALARAYLPRKARLWSFGTAEIASDDGWSRSNSGELVRLPGVLVLEGARFSLMSADRLAIPAEDVAKLIVGISTPITQLKLRVLSGSSLDWIDVPLKKEGSSPGTDDRTNQSFEVVWPRKLARIERIEIDVTIAGAERTELRHVVLYP